MGLDDLNLKLVPGMAYSPIALMDNCCNSSTIDCMAATNDQRGGRI